METSRIQAQSYEESAVRCQQCGGMFSNAYQLRFHLHSPGRHCYQCETCSLNLKYKNSLASHQLNPAQVISVIQPQVSPQTSTQNKTFVHGVFAQPITTTSTVPLSKTSQVSTPITKLCCQPKSVNNLKHYYSKERYGQQAMNIPQNNLTPISTYFVPYQEMNFVSKTENVSSNSMQQQQTVLTPASHVASTYQGFSRSYLTTTIKTFCAPAKSSSLPFTTMDNSSSFAPIGSIVRGTPYQYTAPSAFGLYHCGSCINFVCNSESEIQHHFAKHHLSLYHCRICWMSFNDISAARRHFTLHYYML